MKVLKMDLYRAFLNIKFLGLVITTAVLWYLNTRRFAGEDDILSIFFAAVGRSTITYILLVVCGAVYGLSICEDFQDNEIRNILCRSKLKNYILSKVTVCMVGAITAYFLGSMCYLLFEFTRYPLVIHNSMVVENLKELTTFHILLPEHVLEFIILQILMNGICCGCMAVIALGLSPYLRDGFLVLCTPPVLFFILLFISSTLLKLSTDTESIFWIIMTTVPCGNFIFRIILYTAAFYCISCFLLYRGIRRYEYE